MTDPRADGTERDDLVKRIRSPAQAAAFQTAGAPAQTIKFELATTLTTPTTVIGHPCDAGFSSTSWQNKQTQVVTTEVLYQQVVGSI